MAPCWTQEFLVEGFFAVRGVGVEGQPSWLDGGFGRLVVGGEAVGDQESIALGKAQVALDWEPSSHFRAYLHAVGRQEPDEIQGDAMGFTEAYVEGQLFPTTESRFGLGRGPILFC